MLSENDREILRLYGRNVRIAREKSGITLGQLAKESHYSRRRLSTLENGEHDLKMCNSIKLAEALNVDYPSLFSRNFVDERKYEKRYQPNNFLLIFIKNSKDHLGKKDKYQTFFQASVGLDPTTVSNIFTGKTENPLISTLYRMALSIGVDIENLLRRNN